ncbi:PDZ domain-containing protein [bacterium]|jgi:membrane-associated protease RseP (regulator of RpoE activity)|nr:PDZ domain-containing protein [bacterium]
MSAGKYKTVNMTASIFFLLIFFLPLFSFADCGIGVSLDNETMSVTKFSHVSGQERLSPAKKSGMRLGDIIKAVNNRPVSTRQDVDRVLRDIQPNTRIPVLIERNGQDRTYNVVTGKNFTPEIDVIAQELISGKRVALVIAVGRVSNTVALPPNANLNEWKNAITAQLESECAAVYTQCTGVENFSVVDRSRIRSLLDELNFQTTGYVSERARLEIGKLTGATHFLIVEFSRFPSGYNGFSDMLSKKLIDIETGEVLSSVNVTQRCDSSGKAISFE